MDTNHTRGRKRALLGAAIIAIIAAAAAVITAIPAALAVPAAPSIEKTFVGLVGGKLEWTITIHNPTSNNLEFYVVDGDTSAELTASPNNCLLGTGPRYCFVATGATGTATIQTALPANFDECVGGSGTNTVHLFSTANFATAPNELSKASADWSIPAATGCCTAAGQVEAHESQSVANCRNVTIIKQVKNHPNDQTQFTVSLNGTPLSGTISGDGLHVIHTTIDGSVSNIFSEDTPLPTGYHFFEASDHADCSPETVTEVGVTSGTSYILGPGTGDATICFVNFEDPNLSITKTANPAGPVGVGNPIGFDITLTNSGGAIPGVLVPDALPQGANLTWSIVPAVSGCSISGSGASQQLSCDFINFTGTQVIHLTSSPTIPAVCGKITNTATWQEFFPLQRAESAQISQIPNGSASASVTVDCGGTLTVTKLTETNGIVDGSSSALPWAFTIHSNACAYTSASTATVSGVATFTNVPPCNDYQVTETGALNGYTPIASTPPSGSIVVTSGHTTSVTYLNVRTVASGCPVGQTCRPFIPPPQTPPATLSTPTPTVAPPTPTAVPPTATPTRVSVVLGEKTPGITPAPPSTGNGSAGRSSEVANISLAILGLLAAAGGLATLAAAKCRRG